MANVIISVGGGNAQFFCQPPLNSTKKKKVVGGLELETREEAIEAGEIG